ncbi:MAG: DUF1501 domain-containing protein [Fuerstia sp.]|nr:DUF1501 domain-containing protein [Fuerstiella sp.]
MNQTQRAHRTRCDGLSRRGVLRLGQLTGLGIGLSQLRSINGAGAESQRTAKSCVLIWLDGGPSHLETFDLKPDAAKEVRGPLEAIATTVPGVFISECMPQTAQRMNDFAVIRSMTSPLGEHNLGTHYLLTGYRPTPVLEYPSFHAVANQRLRGANATLPNNVAIPDYRVGGAKFSGAGFLPSEFGPFSLGADPAQADFRVRNLDLTADLTLERIERRRVFARQLASWHEGETSSALVLPESSRNLSPGRQAQAALEQALRMVTTPEATSAFRLEEESSETRQRYGPRSVGQSCLLARRLVERGVRFVTVNHQGWDTHDNLYTRLKEGYTGAKVGVGLIPSLDLAVAALVDDLRDRRLLDETLILVMGEFGRTPKVNTAGGRDHWPRVFSVALAGGGVRGGQVIGASDATGESPADRPVTPSDLVCTIYTLLGLDPASELQTDTGRPIRLAANEAQVIQELLT